MESSPRSASRSRRPFGHRRGTDDLPFTDHGFLGKTEDDSTGLIYLSARYYDPRIAKFISTDPLVDLRKPAWANPYAYAGNNPIGLSDPTGLAPDQGNGSWGGLAPPASVMNTLPNETARAEFLKRWKKRQQEYVESRDYREAVRADTTAEAEQMRALDAAQIAYEICDNEMDCGEKAWMAAVRAIYNARNLNDVTLYGEGVRPPGKSGGTRSAVRCRSSFEPGTKVLMADGAVKPIEDVESGDGVVSTDPIEDTTRLETVLTPIDSRGENKLVGLYIRDGVDGATRPLVATDSHPFWVESLNRWLPASQLAPGMLLRTSTGLSVQVDSVPVWSTPDQRVHNLSVSGSRTYYVLAGDNAVLVHNCDGEVHWQKENAHMPTAARNYDAGATGSRAGLAPALQYYKVGQNRLSTVKFDGYDAANRVMIDRKMDVTRRNKTYSQALNQSLALEQNGMTGVWEVPNAAVARAARKILAQLKITNITVRIVAP